MKLSSDELEFCSRFRSILTKYHNNSFLADMPDVMRSLEEEEMSMLLLTQLTGQI